MYEKKQVTWKTSVLLRRARRYETNATGTTRIGLKTKKRRRLNDRWQTVNTSYCTSGLLHLDVRGHGKEVACCCCAWGDLLACVYTRMVLVCFQVNDEVACLLDFKTASRWTAGAWPALAAWRRHAEAHQMEHRWWSGR